MITGYSTVCSVVVLWLMLRYVCFLYLIRIVVFFNRYRSLDCCTVLSGKICLQFLLLWRISLFCPLFSIPCGRTCSTTWMCVPSAGCWHCACCKWGRYIYTTTAPSCCIPASYCHLSVTLQTISIIIVNLQDNRTVFRIFIALLRFSFDSPSYIILYILHIKDNWV